jgi:hypothetical protein
MVQILNSANNIKNMGSLGSINQRVAVISFEVGTCLSCFKELIKGY